MKILLTGASGQLGQELQMAKPADITLFAYNRQQLDITAADKIHAIINELKPDCIINASAYTAVDDAESQKDLAYAINATGPAHLAQAAYIHNARLIHISTDYVFDGAKNFPYLPDDLPNPKNYYGITKLIGEQKIQEELSDYVIIRTSWVYSRFGKNFVKAMLQHFAEREQISMVADQIATPTWAKTLADAIWQLIRKPNITGTYHFTDAGYASKYDFAVAIMEEAINLQLLNKAIAILPIKSEQFPTPAKRPLYAVLDKSSCWRDFGITPIHWRVSLREMLQELRQITLSHENGRGQGEGILRE